MQRVGSFFRVRRDTVEAESLVHGERRGHYARDRVGDQLGIADVIELLRVGSENGNSRVALRLEDLE